MSTSNKWNLKVQWSLISSATIALFWMAKWMITGSMPVYQSVQIVPQWDWAIALPHPIPKVWDCFLGPIYTGILVSLFTGKRDKDMIVGLILGLVCGVGFGLIAPFVFALILAICVGTVFALCEDQFFALGFVLGAVLGGALVSGLVIGLIIALIVRLVIALAAMFQTKTWDVTRFPIP